jgi:hypothetical protein
VYNVEILCYSSEDSYDDRLNIPINNNNNNNNNDNNNSNNNNNNNFPNLVTPWNKVLEKLTVTHSASQEIPAFYGP